MPMRVLIVDDEPIARRRISRLLKLEDDVEVVNEVGSGTDAVAAIKEQRPDLVFLDVQMPGRDGFGVVDAIGSDAFPRVIFVTAHDRYAIRAFEVNALDYLLKPIDDDRFDASRYTAAGPYVRFRFKADQDTFRDLDLAGLAPSAR